MARLTWHHDRVALDDLTLAEAANGGVLNPPMTEHQLRAIIQALGIPPAGYRRNGRSGRPAPTYPWQAITGLHAALLPWLQLHGTMCLTPHALEAFRAPCPCPARDPFRRRIRVRRARHGWQRPLR